MILKAQAHIATGQGPRDGVADLVGFGLDCAIVSPFRRHRQCTFAVRFSAGAEPHRLTVRLLEYRTENVKLFFIIPMGPAIIPGYGSYRHFLHALTREVRRIDRGAAARVVQV